MKFQELRHMDGLKGYLSILDERLLGSHAYGQEHELLPHVVESTVRIFVEQQQYFFETLWSKAIPAKQRIKEIEEGAKREFVETVRNEAIVRFKGDMADQNTAMRDPALFRIIDSDHPKLGRTI